MKRKKEKRANRKPSVYSLKGKIPHINNDILPLFPYKVKGNTMNEQIIIDLLDKSGEIKRTYQKIELMSDVIYDYFSDNITSDEEAQRKKLSEFFQMRTIEQIIYDYLKITNRQIEELRAYLEGLREALHV